MIGKVDLNGPMNQGVLAEVVSGGLVAEGAIPVGVSHSALGQGSQQDNGPHLPNEKLTKISFEDGAEPDFLQGRSPWSGIPC